MEIKLNTNVDSVARFVNGQPGPVRRVLQPVPTAEFASSQALEARLNALSETRSEVVDYARSLLQNPSYPPRETIQQIATLLAIGVQDNNQATES